MSDHFQDRAGLIASLPDDDPERAAALRHAEACVPCRNALTDGEQLMRLIDSGRDDLEVPAASAERVARLIEADMRREPIRQAAWPAALVLAAFVLEVALARHVRSDSRAFGGAIAVLAIAVVLSGVNRGKLPVALAAVATSTVFALSMSSMSTLAPAVGVECTLLELLAASLPWLAFRQVGGPWRARWSAAAVASAGALSGHAALHLTCPVAHADAHLLVFHLGGVVLAAILGALATPQLRASSLGA